MSAEKKWTSEALQWKLQEFLDYERPFATAAKNVADIYAIPLEGKNSIVPEARYPDVFCNIAELAKAHTTFLSELELHVRLWSPLSETGPVLTNFVNTVLPLHAVFDDNRYLAEPAYAELCKVSNKFSKFSMKAQQSAPSGCPTIPGLYELSAGRVEKYSTLIKELRDASDPDGRDYAGLAAAREAAKERLTRYRVAVRTKEDHERLMKVQQRIVDASVQKSFRKFVHANPLQKVSRKAVQQRMFFLFSDVIVYAKHEGGKKFKSKGAIPLGRSWLKDLPDSVKLQNGFQIVAPEKTYTVYADTPGEKEEWLRLISKCIHRLEEANPSLKDNKAEFNVAAPTGLSKKFTLDPRKFDPDYGRIDVKKYAAEAMSPTTSPMASPRGLRDGDGDGDTSDEDAPAAGDAGPAPAAAAAAPEADDPAAKTGPKARPVRAGIKLQGAIKKVMAQNKEEEEEANAASSAAAAAAAADAGAGASGTGAGGGQGGEAGSAAGDGTAAAEGEGPPQELMANLDVSAAGKRVEIKSERPAPTREDGSPIDCGYCNKVIEDGDYICLENKLWLHSAHFACQHCNVSLEGNPYVLIDPKVYCRNCYMDLIATRCSRCGEAIEGKMVRVAGEALHPKCFTCACGATLNPQTYKVSNKNFKPQCDVCFAAECDYEICAACDKPIFGGDTVSALGKTYHAHCFVCDVCRAEITDPAFLVLGNGKPAHQGCVNAS